MTILEFFDTSLGRGHGLSMSTWGQHLVTRFDISSTENEVRVVQFYNLNPLIWRRRDFRKVQGGSG